MTNGSAEPSGRSVRAPRDIGKVVADGIRTWAIAYALLVLGTCTAFAAGATSSPGMFLASMGTALALAATAGLLGGFFGLLFGMPRESERRPLATSQARYTFNSNLLKVSDWITTIIVGLSLVSLRSLPGALDRFATWIAPSLGSPESGGRFGVFLALASFAAVFLLLYVWTTVPLRSHLENEAFDTEQQWTSMMEQMAERKPPEELSRSLQSLSPAALTRIQADLERTPPLLRDLAAREANRRGAGQSAARNRDADLG